MAQKRKPSRSSSRLLALEPRLLFDGAAMVAAQDAMQPESEHLEAPPEVQGADEASSSPSSEAFGNAALFRQALFSAADDTNSAPSISNSTPPLEVAEHSVLNNPGADSVTLSGVTVKGSGQITVTVSLDDPSLGTLNGSPHVSFTGTAAEANEWLRNLTFKSTQDHEIGKESKHAVITVSAQANGHSSSTTLRVDINPTNSPVEFQDEQGNVIDSTETSVVEGSVTTLNGSLLNPVDREVTAGTQSPDQIIYQIETESQYGYLILTATADADSGKRLGAGSIFTHQDVLDGKVKYVHTAKGTDQNLADSFTLLANDGATPQTKSASLTVALDIIPVNQEVIITGLDAVAWEGQPWNAQNVPSIGSSITATNGGDPNDPLFIIIDSLPAKGDLYFDGTLVVAGQRIAYADRDKLTYQAEAGEPDTTNVTFNITIEDSGGGTDRPDRQSGVVNIQVRAINDDPAVDINAGAQASGAPSVVDGAGQTDGNYTLTLRPGQLSFRDDDTAPELITYIVTELPQNGVLVLTVGGERVRLAAGATFTQADINAGRVQFIQTSAANDATPADWTDSFKFNVVDNTLSVFWDESGNPYTRPGGSYGSTGPDAPLTQHVFHIGLNTDKGQGDDSDAIDGVIPNFDKNVDHSGISPDPTASNKGDPVNEGGTVTIGKETLSHTATITLPGGSTFPVPPKDIVYTILGFGFDSGDAAADQAMREQWGNGWNGLIYRDGVALGQYDTFTQADIDAGLITFAHDGSENFLARLNLQVSAPGYGTGQFQADAFTYDIHITPTNNAPDIDGSKHVVIKEGTQDKVIDLDTLTFSDKDDANSGTQFEGGAFDGSLAPNAADKNMAVNHDGDHPLVYVITSLPDHGKLTYTDKNGITRDVTLDDLNTTRFEAHADGSSGLKYSHDGKESAVDSFKIQAIDNRGAKSGEATVSIDIVGVNDGPQIPAPGLPGSGGTADYDNGDNQASMAPGDNQGRNVPVTVDEGGFIVINSSNLNAYDPDSSARQVQYTITAKPAQGRLYYLAHDGEITYLDVGSSFTQDDVNNGRIHYTHSGMEVPADQSGPVDKFTFTLADGAKEVKGNEFHIYSQPTNDGPTVTVPNGPISVTDPTEPTNIPNVSVGDQDLDNGGKLVEDFVQVVVRLQDNQGKLLSAYSGITIAVGAGTNLIVGGKDGNGTYLVLQGSLEDVNAALATLSVKFDSDRDAIYKLEIIADDRLRNDKGELILDENGQATANGGNKNQSNTRTEPSTKVDTENYNWESDPVPKNSDNLSSKTITLWASKDNDLPTVTLPSEPTDVYEDVGYEFSAAKGNGVKVGDTESEVFDSSMRLTLEVEKGSLSFKNTAGVTVVESADGKYVFEGSQTQLQAMLDAGFTFKGNTNYHGDASIKVTVQEDNTQLNPEDSTNRVSDTLNLTVIPVNDKPVVDVGGKVDLGGNDFVDLKITGITDTSDIQGTDNNNSLNVRVVVRFTDAQGNVITTHGGLPIQFRLGTDDATITDGYLELFGSIAEINAKLASLQAKFEGDANATYHLQVIVDDRNYSADGALTGGANGGDFNPDSSSATGVSSVDGTTTWGATDKNVPTLYNIVQGGKNINVSGVNDAPAIVGNGPLAVTEDTTTLVKDAGGNFLQITDTDDFGSNFTVELSATKGTLSFSSITVDGVTISKTGEVYTLVGDKSSINTMLQRLQFTANADLHSAVNNPDGLGTSITMKVTDTALPGSGTALSSQQTFVVQVTAQNDRPTIDKDVSLGAINEDNASTPVRVDSLDFGYSDARDDQSANGGGNTATDFSYIAIVGSDGYDARQGTWQINDGNGWITIPASGLSDTSALVFSSSAQIRFVPADNFHGEPGKLVIRAGDGSIQNLDTSANANATKNLTLGQTSPWSNEKHTIGITVTGVNDSPIINAGGTLPADTEDVTNPDGSTIGSLIQDYDDSRDDQSAIPGGGSNAGALGGVAIVGLEGHDPAQGSWQYSTDNGANWTTIDSSVSTSSAIVLEVGAKVRFVPAADFNGDVSGKLVLRASDQPVTGQTVVRDISADLVANGPWSNESKISTSVAAVNDAPTLSGTPNNTTVTENDGRGGTTINETPLFSDVTVGDVDLGTTPGLDSSIFGAGTITVTIGGYKDGDVLSIPEDANGVAKFTQNGATVTITLTASATLADVKAVIESLRYSSTSDNPTDSQASATRTFTVVVNDGKNQQNGGNAGTGAGLDSDALTATLTILPTNDNPELKPGTPALPPINDADGNTTPTLDLGQYFTDVDGDTVTVTSVTDLPPGLTFDPTTGLVTGKLTPDASQGGPNSDGIYTVTVMVSDGKGGTATETFTYTVTNPAPEAHNDSRTTQEDTPVSGNVITGNTDGDVADRDPDGDALTVTQFEVDGTTYTFNTNTSTHTVNLAEGTLIFKEDGSYTFTPAKDWNGKVPTVTYTISDGEGGTATAKLTIVVTPVNDAPTLKPGTPALPPINDADGNTTPTLDLGQYFTDVDGDTVTVTSVTGLPPGLTFDPTTGLVTGKLTPDASQGGPGKDGIYTVTVEVSDGKGGTATETFTYTVTNPAPEAHNDSRTTQEDTPVSGNVITGNTDGDVADRDPDGDALTVTQFEVDGTTYTFNTNTSTHTVNLAEGTLIFKEDGSYTFTPAKDWNGKVPTVTYTISDGEGGTATAKLTIVVTPVNDAPTLKPGTPALPPINDADGNTTPTLDLGQYFTDVDGDTVTVTSVTGLPPGLTFDPTTGLVTGKLTPDASQGGPGKDGIYTVTVEVSDGKGGTATETFTYTVTNPAPEAHNDSRTTQEDTPVSGNVITGNTDGDVADRDPDGDALTVTQFEVDGTTYTFNTNTSTHTVNLAEGTLIFKEDGSYTFTPAKDWNGKVPTVTYTISDGEGGTATAKLTIVVTPVNDAPTLKPGTPALPPINDADGNTTPTLDLGQYFTDVDGDTVTVTSVTGLPPGLTFDPTTGLVTGKLTPDASQGGPGKDGIYTVTVEVSDGKGGTATETFTYTVTNPAPEAHNDSRTTQEDTPVSGNVITGNTDGDVADRDPDGDALTVTQFEVDGTTYTFNTNTSTHTVNLAEGTLIFKEDGSYTFTPAKDWNGKVPTVTYTISDGEGGTATAKLTIVVTPVNDAPTLKPGTPALPPINDADGNTTPTLDLGQYFTDVDGDTVTVTSVTGLPPGLTFDPTTGLVTGKLTPDASQGGPGKDGIYTVTVEVSDGKGGTATETFTYTVTNPAPEAHDDSRTTAEDTPVSGNVITGNTDGDVADRDPDGDALTVTQFEVDGTTYTFNTNTSTHTVNLAEGTLIFKEDGSYTFTPAKDWNGKVPTVTYTISDGEGGTATAKLTIVVTPVNDAPTLKPGTPALPPINDADGNTTPTLDLGQYFTDVDGDTVTVTSVTGLPPGLTFDPTTGLVTGKLTPDASQGGPGKDGIYTVTVEVSDGKGGTATETFTYTVTNPAPEAHNDSRTTQEDTPVSGNVITGNTDGDVADRDPDGDALTVTQFEVDGTTYTFNTNTSTHTVNLAEGTLIFKEDGSYTFTPAKDWNGKVPTVTYTISDGEGGTATAKLTIVVTPVNDAPTLKPGTPALPPINDADGNTTPTLDLGQYFTDVDGDTVTVTSVTGLPPGLTFDPTTGLVTGKLTPDASQGGPGKDGIYTVTVEVSDGKGGTATETFTYTVTNPPPVAQPDQQIIHGESSTTGNVLSGQGSTSSTPSNDFDPDGDHLVVVGVAAGNQLGQGNVSGLVGVTIPGSHGSLLLDANGNYTYIRTDGGVPGSFTDTFTYTISDGQGGYATTTLTISIDDSTPALTPPASGGVTPGNPSVYESGLPDGSTPDSGSNKTTGKLEIDSPDGLSTITVTPPGGGTPVTLDPSKGITSGTVDTPNGKVTVTYDPGNGTDKPSISWEYELTTPVDNSGGQTPTDSFTITVTDTDGDPSSPTTITVDIVDDKPDAQDDSNSTLVNVPISGELGGNDKPGADGPLTWTTDKQPTHGTVTIDPDTGAYLYTPEPGFVGTDTFTYTVTDKDGSTSTATVTITVTNQPPVAVDDSNVSEPGKPAIGNVLTGGSTGDRPDSDPDGQPVTVTEITVDGKTVQIPSNGSITVELPNKGTLLIGSDGSYSFTPLPMWSGQVPDISYAISDGAGGTDTAVLRITITAIPTASDVPPRIPVEIPSFANQGERPLYDMRGQTPWSGNQFYFPSVFWENPGFGTGSLFPQPFHPVVYVNDEVQRSQTLQQTYAIDGQWANWFEDSNVLRTFSKHLGMDPALFVQHAVRDIQWERRLNEFLARNMQTNLPTESPQQDLPSALLSTLPESLNDTSTPASDSTQPTEANGTSTEPLTSADFGNESFSELLERWNTAEAQTEGSEIVSLPANGKSSSFSEQLQQSAHQLPSHIG